MGVFEDAHKATRLKRADLEYAEESSSDDHIEGRIEDYLWDCERALEGDVLALYDVIGHCQELQTPLPAWAADSLQRIIAKGVTGEPIEPRARGRHGTASKVYSDQFKAYLRHDAVTRVRYYQILGPCIFTYMALPVGLKRTFAGRPLPDFGKTVDEALEAARMSLAGSFAQCSLETIRKAFRNPENAMLPNWAMASDEALQAIGVELDQNEYWPEHQTHAFVPKIEAWPSQIEAGILPVKLDERSQKTITEARKFIDFNDFAQAVREKKVVL